MKRIYIISLIIIASAISSIFFYRASKAEECCKKCTGSAYCTACKNCSGCAYCNSGGSCGVCSSDKSTPSTKKTSNKSSNNSYNSSNSDNVDNSIGNEYDSNAKYPYNTTLYANKKTINIRKEPSTTSQILCTINQGETVTVNKYYDEKWIQVEVICSNGTSVVGYVYAEYLSK